MPSACHRHPARHRSGDPTELIPLIEAVPPLRGKRGRPPQRPRNLYADRRYDHDVYRDKVRRFQITPHIEKSELSVVAPSPIAVRCSTRSPSTTRS